MVINYGNSVDWRLLNDSVIPDLTQIIVFTPVPCFFEVVMKRGIEYAELCT